MIVNGVNEGGRKVAISGIGKGAGSALPVISGRCLFFLSFYLTARLVTKRLAGTDIVGVKGWRQMWHCRRLCHHCWTV